MDTTISDFRKLKLKVFFMFFLSAAILGLMLFLPAGTFDYWQAWLFLAVLFLPFLFVVSYLVKNDPALLDRRMRFREKVAEQKRLIDFSKIFFFFGFLVPGFDFRYRWSSVPSWLVIASDVIIFAGYMIIFSVFRENQYTSRIIEVERGQKVISTGPYSIVRHPMYAGIILMFIFMPIALGSFWALIPLSPAIGIIIPRLLNEEIVLSKELKGYEEYTKKVRYRLIPGVW
jgi:protein-S-isoprenylcysteine O-methyltransferase Ste14